MNEPRQIQLLPEKPDQRDVELIRWCREHAREPIITDTIEAADAWGANCGPMSLAAVLGLSTVEAARRLVEPFRGFMSPTDMLGALAVAVRTGVAVDFSEDLRSKGSHLADRWPALGLVRIQWLGPWCEPGVNPRAAYRYTHWIGVRTIEEEREVNSGSCRSRSFSHEVMVYDATPNRWIPLWVWERWCSTLWPRRATGWAPVTRIDVTLAAGEP